jgi:hypothetical protein
MNTSHAEPLLVLGASEEQLPLYRDARRRGLLSWLASCGCHPAGWDGRASVMFRKAMQDSDASCMADW